MQAEIFIYVCRAEKPNQPSIFQAVSPIALKGGMNYKRV